MNRRILVFLVLVNALVSLAIAVTVVWIAEQRRPSMAELVLPSTHGSGRRADRNAHIRRRAGIPRQR